MTPNDLRPSFKKIIEDACRKYHSDLGITPMCFVLGVIDYLIDQPAQSAEDPEEWLAFYNMFSSRFAVVREDGRVLPENYLQIFYNEVRAAFEANRNNPSALLDWRVSLIMAKSEAEKQKYDSIPASIMLRLFLKSPSGELGAAIDRAAKKIEQAVNDNAMLIHLDEDPDDGFEPYVPPTLPHEESSYESLEEEDENDEKAPGSAAEVVQLTKEANRIKKELSGVIYGQDHAIGSFISGYFRAEITDLTNAPHDGPKAVFLFAGPPGVGKSMLAKFAMKEMLNLPWKEYDMSVYADENSAIDLIGSAPHYSNSKKGDLTTFVEEHPNCVLLFDEIEKAHVTIINLFLQVLDAGTLRDASTQQEISFRNTIIIFTTNAGHQLYEEADSDDLSSLSRKVIIKALETDVDKFTGRPYFPAAICSRLGTGNVVMFNRLGPYYLRRIAESQIMSSAKRFGKRFGVDFNIDERVYTAMMFAEGGSGDGRTIKSRATTFIDDEIFELFRLAQNAETGQALREINVSVDLTGESEEIRSLFAKPDKKKILLFTGEEYRSMAASSGAEAEFLFADKSADAIELLKENAVDFALIDFTCGIRAKRSYLNIEDEDSEARDLFWYLHDSMPDVSVYMLIGNSSDIGYEEQLSYLYKGVRGTIASDDPASFASQVNELLEKQHHYESVMSLARQNKIMTYETSQSISPDGSKADIRLFDFELATAVDSEDSANIMNSLSIPNVEFRSVYGADNAINELKFFVNYLKNPKKFRESGLPAPKGVLLYGPPGTGKTMLAKAMAHEANVTFINCAGSDFRKKELGGGSERVRQLFRIARKYAPSIIFIDEVDAIARSRDDMDTSEGAEAEIESTLTTFLSEMDGFKKDVTRPVFVLAATNFSVDQSSKNRIDAAFIRRFDRSILIDLPVRSERERFLKDKIGENRLFNVSDKIIENIALRSIGMSLASLTLVLDMAMRQAMLDGKDKITDEVLEEAFETFNGGEVNDIDPAHLERTAVHEAGHSVLLWLSGEKPSYVTVVARGDHGGYMQHGDNEKKGVYTREELLARIRTSLGGRAAEIVRYGEENGYTTGASGDLQHATMCARSMISQFGMGGSLGMAVISDREMAMGPVSSEVRAAVNRILDEQFREAIRILNEKRPLLDALSSALLDKDRLDGEEIDAILKSASDGMQG